jgi:hypothetical protein
MHTALAQRWRDRRDFYRPAGEPIVTRHYDVAAIADDRAAKAFVLAHHYAASYPAARFRFGLYRRGGALCGVAVFSHPCSDRVLTNVFAGVPAPACVELGRFVLLDAVPANGETWFLGRCFELLRRSTAIVGVVSFADPQPRSTSAGDVVFPGHVGTIYQAHNARYLGRGTPRRLRLLPDGTVLSERAIAKLVARDRGWAYVARLLVAAGAAEEPGGDLRAWAGQWVPRLTRPLRHRGNHKYAWALAAAARRALPAPLAYPKWNHSTLKEITACPTS